MEITFEQNIEIYEVSINNETSEMLVEISNETEVFEVQIEQLGVQGLQGEKGDKGDKGETGLQGQIGTTNKQQFTAIENQTEFTLNKIPKTIEFFTRNGIEIALNSRFISENNIIYVPIENNGETIKQNDRIIITYI